jgi:RNase adaptor protein for sRNA GlmZ degradation
MAYSIRRKAVQTKESKKAEQLAKLLTEDFSIDLERVGYYLVRNLPLIVFHRFDVLALTAQEEYDKLMVEMKGRL